MNKKQKAALDSVRYAAVYAVRRGVDRKDIAEAAVEAMAKAKSPLQMYRELPLNVREFFRVANTSIGIRLVNRKNMITVLKMMGVIGDGGYTVHIKYEYKSPGGMPYTTYGCNIETATAVEVIISLHYALKLKGALVDGNETDQ